MTRPRTKILPAYGITPCSNNYWPPVRSQRVRSLVPTLRVGTRKRAPTISFAAKVPMLQVPPLPATDQHASLRKQIKALAVVLREEFGVPFAFYEVETGVLLGQPDD